MHSASKNLRLTYSIFGISAVGIQTDIGVGDDGSVSVNKTVDIDSTAGAGPDSASAASSDVTIEISKDVDTDAKATEPGLSGLFSSVLLDATTDADADAGIISGSTFPNYTDTTFDSIGYWFDSAFDFRCKIHRLNSRQEHDR